MKPEVISFLDEIRGQTVSEIWHFEVVVLRKDGVFQATERRTTLASGRCRTSAQAVHAVLSQVAEMFSTDTKGGPK